MLGVAVIIALLVFVPDNHQDAGFVFGERINNTGFDGGATGGLPFWFLVMPIGFLLTMYTQTGYDASAHTAEETRGAAIAAAQGVWRAVFWSAVIGWFVLLALLFAANDVKASTTAAAARSRSSRARSSSAAAKAVLLIATVGQIFCVWRADQRVAHLVRVLARPRRYRAGGCSGGLNHQRVPTTPCSRCRSSAPHHDPGAVEQRGRLPVRVLRAHGHLHRRPLPGVHHSRCT